MLFIYQPFVNHFRIIESFQNGTQSCAEEATPHFEISESFHTTSEYLAEMELLGSWTRKFPWLIETLSTILQSLILLLNNTNVSRWFSYGKTLIMAATKCTFR